MDEYDEQVQRFLAQVHENCAIGDDLDALTSSIFEPSDSEPEDGYDSSDNDNPASRQQSKVRGWLVVDFVLIATTHQTVFLACLCRRNQRWLTSFDPTIRRYLSVVASKS
jgi:hypothetical protein